MSISPNTNALLLVSDCSTYIAFDIADQTQVDKIQLLINQASDFIVKYLKYNPKATSYHLTNLFQLNTNKFSLPNYPVNSITSLTISGTSYTQNTDYFLDSDSGVLSFYNSFQGLRPNLVDCVYNAGYSVLPSDLFSACLELITWNYTRVNTSSFGVKSQITGENQTTVSELQAPLSIRNVLDSYKRISFSV